MLFCACYLSVLAQAAIIKHRTTRCLKQLDLFSYCFEGWEVQEKDTNLFICLFVSLPS